MLPESEEKSLSKRQQKKAIKSLEFAKFKEERNFKRKERKKAKKLDGSTRITTSLPIKNAVPSGLIILDCSYETLMNEKEIRSLCAQISRCYAMNRRADIPFALELQKFGTKLSQIMGSLNPDYLMWKNVTMIYSLNVRYHFVTIKNSM
jgi:tRNA (guanine9-N1)-methyltransferase